MIITDEKELRKECKEVSIFEGQEIILQLEKELMASKQAGVGLAAPQIGIMAKVCVLRTAHYKLDLINPKIIEKKELCSFKGEGCLSFPNVAITTKRYKEIFVIDALRPTGTVLTDLEAVIAQHEIGHTFRELMYDYEIKIPERNEKCWCGLSNKKFKKCCIDKEIK